MTCKGKIPLLTSGREKVKLAADIT